MEGASTNKASKGGSQAAKAYQAGAPGLPQLMTQTQKQEQYSGIQSKLTMRPTLTEQCPKHEGQLIIFLRGQAKFCERCYVDEEKAQADKKDGQQAS